MKPCTHKALTAHALTLLSKKLSPSFREFTQEIINGSGAEDNWWELSRSLNWHFYRSNVRMKRKYHIFHVSSELILEKRVAVFLDAGKPLSMRLFYLGRILHHIQDMSTPSHVIPIYHGPAFPREFSLGVIPDYLEDFLEEHLSLIGDLKFHENKQYDFKTFPRIYAHSAEHMLHEVLKVDDEASFYANFWCYHTCAEDAKFKGFGTYGKYHTYFKQLPVEETDISQEMLLEIAQMVLSHAVDYTCYALLVADDIIGKNS